MTPLTFFTKTRADRQGTASLSCTAAQLGDALASVRVTPMLVTGFVSPHLDIDQVAAKVKQRFPSTVISLCTTSGELCNGASALYCPTGDRWDSIVLQLFDNSVIASAEVVMLPLECVSNIKRTQVRTPIDHWDTLAYVVFDGLSASESFFMEALYESGRFPCLFVGGSAGGTTDFKKP